MLILKRSAFALLMILLWSACTKPTQDIKIVVDTNVIKFTALVHVTDAANNNNPQPGLSMSLSGQDAANIYEISGKKNFTISNGIISLGPAPGFEPVDGKPVKFNVILTAPGYTSVTQAIQINAGQTQQVVNISMVKTNTVAPPPVAIVSETTAPVVLNFIGTCANKTNFELHPTIYIFYRVHGATTGYQYLGYMQQGTLTAQLVMGRTYDFELTYNGSTYSITQQIDANINTYTKTIDMGDVCNTF